MLKICVLDVVSTLCRVKVDTLCCPCSFHVRRAVVVVVYTLKEDRDTGTAETEQKAVNYNINSNSQHICRHSLKWNVFLSRMVSFLLAVMEMLYPRLSSTIHTEALQSGEHAG